MFVKSLCTEILIRLLVHGYDAIMRTYKCIIYIHGTDGSGWGGGRGMDCQWLAGLVSLGFIYELGKITIASSDNSSGLVSG